MASTSMAARTPREALSDVCHWDFLFVIFWRFLQGVHHVPGRQPSIQEAACRDVLLPSTQKRLSYSTL